MLNKIITLIAAAALSGTVSANVQAATFNADTQINVPSTIVESMGKWNTLITDRIQPEKQDAAKLADFNMSVLQIKEWDNLITDLIHPQLNLVGVNTTVAVKQEKITVPAAAEPMPTVAKAVVVPPRVEPVRIEVAPAVAEPTPVVAAPAVTAAPSPAPVKEEAAPAAPEPTPAPVKVEAPPAPKPTPAPAPAAQKVITVKATAYTASCEGCSGITRTGVNIKDNPHERVIAVDPKVIPLGSKVYVEGFGEATAADTGGAIKGNRIDVFIPTQREAMKFGVKHLKVTILN